MTEIDEQKKFLRAQIHSLLTRCSKWSRGGKIGLVFGGLFVAAIAEAATTLLDPAEKWVVYIFQIIVFAPVFAGGFLMGFPNEGHTPVIKSARKLVGAINDRDESTSSVGENSERVAHIYAIAAALRMVVEGVAASGSDRENEQERRFAAMFDTIVADKATLVVASEVRDRSRFRDCGEETARCPEESLIALAKALALVIRTADQLKEEAGPSDHSQLILKE
ncbi:hypothetical protein [Methylocapsa acidiphila]|uniref:hypothetical protein n=1 Tax=Methylocapsa acidiphila TaxID=133552 RepID=UPI0005663FBE|nr:hypothetical protein [Methylocapsa acidiphila]